MNGVSQDEDRVDSGYEGRIELRLSSKPESMTRSIIVPLRELDVSGSLSKKSMMHFFHTY